MYLFLVCTVIQSWLLILYSGPIVHRDGVLRTDARYASETRYTSEVRHAHRLDHEKEGWREHPWYATHLYDSPLSPEGVEKARNVGAELRRWTEQNDTDFRAVIASPYPGHEG